MEIVNTQLGKRHSLKTFVKIRSMQILMGLAVISALFISFAPIEWIVFFVIVGVALFSSLSIAKFPILGVFLVVITAPLAAYEARAGIPFIGFLPISIGQISFLTLIFVWLVERLVNKRVGLPYSFSFTWLLVFAAVSIVTTLTASSAADGAKEVVKWIQLGLMMLISLDLIGSESQKWEAPQNGVWIFVFFLACGSLIQAIVGILQFANPDGPESFLILGRFFRAFGTFEQPNPYGGYLTWHLVFFIGLVLPTITNQLLKFIGVDDDQNQQGIHWLLIIGLLALSGVIGVALIASWSRGAWLAALAGLCAVAFYLPRDRKVGVLLIVVAFAALLIAWQSGLLPTSLTARIASSTEIEFVVVRDQEISPENYAVLERQAFWQAALSMFESNIWTGVGFGNYDAAYPDHYVGTWERSLGHAHNYYINLLAEMGLLGLIAYLGLWTAIIWRLVSILGHLDLIQRGLALGVLGVWISLGVHHLVDKLYVNNNWLTLGLFLAVQEILIQTSVSKTKTERTFEGSSR
ncbi:MAG: O-antigen ligase family protein [Chloroflexota bacterium]